MKIIVFCCKTERNGKLGSMSLMMKLKFLLKILSSSCIYVFYKADNRFRPSN